MNCGHCGYPGELVFVKNVVAEEQDDPYGYIPPDHELQVIWQVQRCPRCKKPTIYEYNYIEARDAGMPMEMTRIVPFVADDSALPPRVAKLLGQARQVKFVGADVYGAAMRRTIEAVCNDQGAEGKNLFRKIEDLVKKGTLSPRMAALAHGLREAGKFGAHDDDVDL